MKKQILSVLTAYLLTVFPAISDQPNPKQVHNINSIWFDNWVGLSNATLKVAAPNGKVTSVFEASRSPVYRLTGTKILDGIYRYELRAASDERIAADPNRVGNGDEELPDDVAKPYYVTGAFLVRRGAIVTPEPIEDIPEEED